VAAVASHDYSGAAGIVGIASCPGVLGSVLGFLAYPESVY
jgi:hypothetical protein